MPECTTNVLQQCEHQALINAYDNSIAYTDQVLAQTIAWLKPQAARHDTTLLYLSDHGESLGENNLYLHGLPDAVAPVEQKHVPMVLWQGPHAHAQAACLAAQRDAIAGVPTLPATLCDGDECLDEALLHGIDARLTALPAAARERGVLLILHQMGSHGPAYYKRSPPQRKPFQPECTTNVLQQCAHAALINAYDNSIAYTDHVLAQTVDWLKQQAPRFATAMLYVSDHGESLGENNLYLHGLPYALAPVEQKHVPMLLWLGADERLPSACLNARRDAALTHDHLFHTTLGLLGIRAAEYQMALDAFAICRAR